MAGFQNDAGGTDEALDGFGTLRVSSAGGAGAGAGVIGDPAADGVGSIGLPSMAGGLPQDVQPETEGIIAVCWG
jgi:hypothetical protein